MKERQLTEEQKSKIEEIKDQWEKEYLELEKTFPPSDGRTLDGERTWKTAALGKKYREMIQAVMEE